MAAKAQNSRRPFWWSRSVRWRHRVVMLRLGERGGGGGREREEGEGCREGGKGGMHGVM